KEKKEVQAAAAGALGGMGTAGVASLVAAIKEDATDNDVRRKAVESGGLIGPHANAAHPAPGKAGRSGGRQKNPNKDADLHLEAATSLGQIATAKDKDALDALQALGGGKDLKKNKNLGDAVKKAIREIEMRK